MKVSAVLCIALAAMAFQPCTARADSDAQAEQALASEIERGAEHGSVHGVYDPVASPDGRNIAFIRAGKERTDPSSLWLFDRHTRRQRRLLVSHRTDDNTTNLRSLSSPVFSPDGRSVFFLSAAWVTSDALFRFDLKSGRHRYVAAANSAIVVREGPYQGDVIMGEHAYNSGPEGGSFEQLVLIRPNGKRVMILPEPNDGADPEPWLKGHGWTAD